MLTTTAQEIADIVHGRLVGGATGEETVTGQARLDSREVQPGDLFAAFQGEHVDGHRFVGSARDHGAALALVSREVEVPAVVVEDVGEALAQLATAQLERARQENPALTVIAITGSAGKTGTKDLLGVLLRPLGETVAPAGSLNNELGLPLTVLALTDITRFLVLEMGARGIGHIAHLASIARPDISVVLNVGTAHLGEFGSADNIARAKGELVEALQADGRAVLYADDPRVLAMAERSAAPVVTWGEGQGDVRIEDLRLDADARAAFTLRITRELERADGTTVPAGAVDITTALLGEHQARNVAAAATAALLAGADPQDLAGPLATARLASGGRMEVLDGPHGITLINDAYNANPDSMRQALRTLAHLGRGRRTIAVLGEMLELGEDTIRLHDEIGRVAVRLNISHLIAVGRGAMPIHQGASLEGSFGGESEYARDLEQALTVLEREAQPGDVILLKSSRDAGLRTLVNPLLERLRGGSGSSESASHDAQDTVQQQGTLQQQDTSDKHTSHTAQEGEPRA